MVSMLSFCPMLGPDLACSVAGRRGKSLICVFRTCEKNLNIVWGLCFVRGIAQNMYTLALKIRNKMANIIHSGFAIAKTPKKGFGQLIRFIMASAFVGWSPLHHILEVFSSDVKYIYTHSYRETNVSSGVRGK